MIRQKKRVDWQRRPLTSQERRAEQQKKPWRRLRSYFQRCQDELVRS